MNSSCSQTGDTEGQADSAQMLSDAPGLIRTHRMGAKKSDLLMLQREDWCW